MSEQVIKLGRKAQEDREIKDFRTMERCVGTEHPVTRNAVVGKEVSYKEVAFRDWELKIDEPT